MAQVELRHSGNIEGDFFVDTTCIDCDLCRQIAPETFVSAGDQSVVHRQPQNSKQQFAALKALVTCPTASIGTLSHLSAKAAVEAYPEPVDENVYFCGFAAESSYGASSYLIVRPEENVLIDSPRFATPLVRRIEKMGGIRLMFLTHRDDVADHEKWARHFGATRVLHRDDVTHSTASVERVLTGCDAIQLDGDLLAVPAPGHTRGHTVLLYGGRYLFSGDHVWWSQSYKSLHASRNVCWYSWEEQTQSMERLVEHDFEWVLPGHGRRVHMSATQMRQQVKQCVARMKGELRAVAS
jgi:glyoxylase-like metal-dependent hydrolase (beta-lactamase superfamily II)/ferredoxin